MAMAFLPSNAARLARWLSKREAEGIFVRMSDLASRGGKRLSYYLSRFACISASVGVEEEIPFSGISTPGIHAVSLITTLRWSSCCQFLWKRPPVNPVFVVIPVGSGLARYSGASARMRRQTITVRQR